LVQALSTSHKGDRILNGVHDIGGMDGFGAIQHETDEPVFHEPWESRVFGMSMVNPGLPKITLDARRHQLERIPPHQYLSSSYYERWLARIDAALVEAGTLTREEIDRRMQEFAADPDQPLPRREDPAWAEGIANALRAGRPATRTIRPKPRFAIGDKIVTRNLNPHGHTRLPRYARGKHGVIVAHHGAHVFPDANAHGLGENPQHLYTVCIAMRELWGSDAEPNESVLIDLWESYLEKDQAAVKSTIRKSVPAAKKITVKKAMAKTLARAAILPHLSRKKAGEGQAGRAAPLRFRANVSAATLKEGARSGRGSAKPTRRSR
jgi:nitrile hydratase beta subunit